MSASFDKILRLAGIDTSQKGSEMAKFTAGVTAGVVEMRDHPTMDCAKVKQSFQDVKAKMG